MTDLEAIRDRAKNHHTPCTADVCGSRVCQTARDRDTLLEALDAKDQFIEEIWDALAPAGTFPDDIVLGIVIQLVATRHQR